MIFVGYEIASKAYRLWDPKAHKIVVSANVKFDETVLPNKPIATPPPAKPLPSTSKLLFPPSPKPEQTLHAPWFFDDDEEPKPKPPPASTDKGKQWADRPITPPTPPSPPS